MTECHGKNWNLYGSFWTDKSLAKTSVRLGVASYAANCQSDNRLRVNSASGSHNFYWYHRTLSTVQQVKLGLLSVVDLTNRVVQKNNILIGHAPHKSHELFLRLENDGFRTVNPQINDFRSLWDTVTANYVGKLDRYTRVGLEVILLSIILDPNRIERFLCQED